MDYHPEDHAHTTPVFTDSQSQAFTWDFIRHAPWLTIIVGHYGVGKTNFCLNLIESILAGADASGLTLIDLDIVNPYFRSSEASVHLEVRGVRLLGPVYARSTLDTPSLAPGIDDAMHAAGATHPVLVDVGGDPDGARALARFADVIEAQPYRMVFLANFKRPEVGEPESALSVLRLIEAQSHLRVSGLIGNTHLKEDSEVADILDGWTKLEALARLTNLPIMGITAPANLTADVQKQLDCEASAAVPVVMPMQILVGSPWEIEP